jgi:hypothetical protein
MTDKKLLSSLSKLGFPMFEVSEEPDVNETMAEVVKSNDTRLWEGFPVLLANAAERYQFAPEQVRQLLRKKEHKNRFHLLVLLTGSLFSFYHLSFPWWKKLKQGLSEKDKNLVKKWRNNFVHDQPLKLYNFELDSQRLKGLFGLYFEKKGEKERRRKEKYIEYSLEHALSQIFPPKQKELFKKKLEGLPLNKTEQEYYSRRVKKKVVALANSELHNMAKKLLEM